jgi:hypothetical protein
MADSSRPMLREEADSSRTILATVLGVIPTEMPAQEKKLAPPPVGMEANDDGVRRRPVYKDSYGSVRPLPFTQPPSQDIESALDAVDTGPAPPPLTYMDSVGIVRPLAQVVASVSPSVPPAQDIESALDTMNMDSDSRIRPLARSFPPTQNNESAPDENEADRVRRPTYTNRTDTRPSPVASMPRRVPLAQDNATTLDEIDTGAGRRPMYKDCFGSARLSATENPPVSAAVILPIADAPQLMKPKKVDEASDIFYDDIQFNEDEVGNDKKKARALVTKPKEIDETSNTSYDEMELNEEEVRSDNKKARALVMKSKEVDETSNTSYDEKELNEDEVGSDNKKARALVMKPKEVDKPSNTTYDGPELNKDEVGSDNKKAHAFKEKMKSRPESKMRWRPWTWFRKRSKPQQPPS